MAWIPSYISAGGMYGGRKIPQGSVTKFAELGFIVGENIVTNAYLRSDQSDVYNWDGAFGCSSDALLAALGALGNEGEVENSLLFEMEVKKPEGATYYRQTLAVFCNYSRIVRQPSTYEEELNTFSISGVYRREYATPYSTPTSTLLHQGISGCNFNKILQVDPNTLKPAYYFEYNRILLGMSRGVRDGKVYFGPYFYVTYTQTTTDYDQRFYGYAGIPIEVLEEEFGGSFEPEETDDPNENPDPDPDDPDEGEGGGEGDQDKSEDPIPIPDTPSLGAADAGFITMYKMSLAQIHQFAADLFANPLDPAGAWQCIKAFFADPMDFICGVMILPVDPDVVHSRYPKFGAFTWPNAYPVINNQFFKLDLGNLYIPKFYNTCFDANPYTRVRLFVPYIGYRDLNADEVVGQTLHIRYHIDLLTGDCIAFVEVTGEKPQVIAQYSGNCALRVPFGRVSFDAAVAAGIQLLGGAVGTIAGGIAAASGLSGGNLTADQIANTASAMTVTAVNSMKTTSERAGVAGASAGYMSLQKPHIIREIPDQALATNYRQLEGYPANIGGLLSDFLGTGFTAVEKISLENVGATDAEKDEINQLLIGGIIL